MKIVFNQENGLLHISSEAHVCKYIESFAFTNANEHKTLSTKDIKNKSRNHRRLANHVQKIPNYRKNVRAANYLAGSTRPDVANSAAVVSRFINDHRSEQITVSKKIFKYLKTTPKFGVHFSCDLGIKICVSADADFTGNYSDHHSTLGLVVFLRKMPVMWQSHKINRVVHSTFEAEYNCLRRGTQMSTI